MIITTTDDKKINEKILKLQKTRKIFAYSSDNPEKSDFSNPAIIDFKNIVQIAIFTGGQSPAMSKKLRKSKKMLFKKIIKKRRHWANQNSKDRKKTCKEIIFQSTR